MLAFLLLVQISPVPPPAPDPPAASRAEALALWNQHPFTDEQRQAYVRDAISDFAFQLMDRKLLNSKRVFDASGRLTALLRVRANRVITKIDQAVADCATRSLAWSMTAEHIELARRFVLTPAGEAFWRNTGQWSLARICYKEAVWPNLVPLTPDELRLAGQNVKSSRTR